MPAPPSPRPLRLRPEIGELALLTDYIEAVAEEHRLAAADTRALTLAAEELFANTINHGAPPASSIEFSLTVGDHTATAVYADDAGMFDPTAHPEVDTTLPLDQRPIGGLGIHFIRKTMQSFHYRRIADWNRIAFGRKLTR
jgi:anti-sigma regulatory factor (Ser/Thr protein kinase)